MIIISYAVYLLVYSSCAHVCWTEIDENMQLYSRIIFSSEMYRLSQQVFSKPFSCKSVSV